MVPAALVATVQSNDLPLFAFITCSFFLSAKTELLSSFQVQYALWESIYSFGGSWGGASWSWINEHARDLTSKVNLTISCNCLKFHQLKIFRSQLQLRGEGRSKVKNFHKTMSTIMTGGSFRSLPYWPQLLSVQCKSLHLLLLSSEQWERRL